MKHSHVYYTQIRKKKHKRFNRVLSMGRHRKSEEDKKIPIKLSISKKYVDELKQRGVNISQLFEQFVKNFLDR